MFLTYRSAKKRAQAGYDFIAQFGPLYNLSLEQLREASANGRAIMVQSKFRCPLALALISDYPGATYGFEGAISTIRALTRWDLKRMDEFVTSHGFDIVARVPFVPDAVQLRQWRLLDKAWGRLLAQEPIKEPRMVSTS